MSESAAARFSVNITWLTVSQVLYRLATIAVFSYIGLALGAEVLGQYAIIMGVLNLYLAFSDLGVSNFVIKEVSRDRSLGELYLNNFFALQIAVGILIIGLSMLTGMVSGYSALIMYGLAIGSCGLVFNGAANAYKALLSANEVLHPFAIIEVLCAAVYIAGNTLAIVLGQGLLSLVAVTVAVQIVKYIAGMLWARRYNMHVAWKFSKPAMGSLLWLGLPFLLFNSAHFAIQRLDVLLIGAIDSELASGIYAAASRLIYSSLFVISVIGTALYPVFSRLLHEQREKAVELFHRSSLYVYVVACASGAAFYGFAPLIVRLLFGEEFVSTIPLLQFLSFYIPVFALGLLPSNLLMVSDRVWQAAVVSVGGVALMTAAVFLVYPRYMSAGVSAVVVGVELLMTIAYIAMTYKYLRIGLRISVFLASTAVYAISIAAAYFASPLPTAAAGTISLAVFTLGILLFGIIRKDDLRFIANIFLHRTRTAVE